MSRSLKELGVATQQFAIEIRCALSEQWHQYAQVLPQMPYRPFKADAQLRHHRFMGKTNAYGQALANGVCNR